VHYQVDRVPDRRTALGEEERVNVALGVRHSSQFTRLNGGRNEMRGTGTGHGLYNHNKLVRPVSPCLTRHLNNLGVLYRDTQRLAKAETAFTEAEGLQQNRNTAK